MKRVKDIPLTRCHNYVHNAIYEH